jgi:hypothetical protein
MRAYGAVHVNVALVTLRAAVRRRDLPTVLGLNLGCDLGDLVATGLEVRRGLPPVAAVGSAVVQLAGMTVWSTCAALERDGHRS